MPDRQPVVQKRQNAPPPTKKLCWRVFPVGASGKFGSPAQKSRSPPRMLSLLQTFTSSPTPISTAALVLELPGLLPPKTRVLLWLIWPTPAPKLTHGETAVVGNRFSLAAGVINNSLYLVG